MANRFSRFAEEKETGNRFAQFAKPKPAESDRDKGFLAYLNQGLASTLGAPVDLAGKAIEGASQVGQLATTGNPFFSIVSADEVPEPTIDIPDNAIGGSKNIAQTMDRAGMQVAKPGSKPETIPEYIGQGIGDAAGALIPGAGIVGMASRSANPVVRGASQTVARPFVSSPGRALASETAAAGGFGLGASISEEVAPDNPYAQVAGGLIGGVAGGMGPGAAKRAAQSLPVTGTGIRLAKKAAVPFTEAGAMERARDRIRSLAEDPDAAYQRISEESPGGLSPAQQTGDENLMAIERQVRTTHPPTNLAMRSQEADSNAALQEMLRGESQGATVSDAQDFIGGRLNERLSKMDETVRSAGQKAQERIERLAPQRKASESSMFVREELENALVSARQEERRLWNTVPKSEQAPTENVRRTYAAILEDTPSAQRDDIPAKARTFLDREQSNQAFGDRETISELHGLYSAMRQDARMARAAGEMNKARIADELADSLLDDMGATQAATTNAGQRINEARAFSQQLNQKFRQGSIGRILGYAREGGSAVPPEATLDTSIGRGGTGGAVSADEIRRATGGSQNAEAAAQDYLRKRFEDYSIRDGRFNPRRAEDFIRNNDELLDRFPALKRPMQDAEQAQKQATNAERRIEGRAKRLRDPRQSRAAAFLNAPVDQEIQTVLRARNPGAAAAELRRQASKDKSGNAARGLKGGFLDFLMDKARTGEFDEAGENFLSGRGLLNALRDPRIKAVADEFLTGDERNRLQQIAQEFQKLETARGRLPEVGGVMQDAPNKIISLIGRTIAARSGARMGEGTSGASLLTAGFASRRMQQLLDSLTNDRAEALIREAVTGDRDLFRILLSEASPRSDKAANRLIETLAAITGNAVGDLNENEEGQPLELTITEPANAPERSAVPTRQGNTQGNSGRGARLPAIPGNGFPGGRNPEIPGTPPRRERVTRIDMQNASPAEKQAHIAELLMQGRSAAPSLSGNPSTPGARKLANAILGAQ